MSFSYHLSKTPKTLGELEPCMVRFLGGMFFINALQQYYVAVILLRLMTHTPYCDIPS